jgi:hypothetical protein
MADQETPPPDPFKNVEKTPGAATSTIATETHPALSKSLRAENPVFLEEDDSDIEPEGLRDVAITPEFVRKTRRS